MITEIAARNHEKEIDQLYDTFRAQTFRSGQSVRRNHFGLIVVLAGTFRANFVFAVTFKF